MSAKRFFIPLKCNERSCPAFSLCVGLKTEVIGIKQKAAKVNGVDVLLIGEAAGAEEAAQRRCFVGESGYLLRKTIEHTNKIPNRTYALSNVCRHRPVNPETGDNRPPTLQEFSHCKKHLAKDIKRLKPKLIVTLGAVPYRYLMESDSPSFKDYGIPVKANVLGHDCMLMPAHHPARILRQIGLLTDFVNQLRRAFGYCDKYPCINNAMKHHFVRDPDKVANLVQRLMQSERQVAFDTEAINVNRVYDNRCLSVQLSNDGINSFVIPIDHVKFGVTGEHRDKILKALRDLFGKKSNIDAIMAHNAVFDLHMIRNTLLSLRLVPHTVIDTMVQAYLLDENYANSGQRYGLKPLAYMYGYDYDKNHVKALYARVRGELELLTKKEFVEYGGADACVTWQLYHIQHKAAYLQPDYGDKCERMLRHFYSNLVQFYTEMESNGLPVNKEHVLKLVDKNKSVVKQHKKKLLDKLFQLPEVKQANKLLLKDAAGVVKGIWGTPTVFDIKSPKHRQKLFFDVLGYEPLSYGKSGDGSVDTKFLDSIKGECKAAEIVTKYSKVEKLDNSFIEPIYKKLLQESDAKDLHIRSSFGSTTTVTGRGSSTNPNCLSYSTYVATRDMGSLMIGDIVNGDFRDVDLTSFGLKGRITACMTKKVSKYVIVRTECGRQFEGGLKHPLFVKRASASSNSDYQWVKMAHISRGDCLLLELGFQKFVKERRPPMFEEFPVKISENVCTYLGLLLSSSIVNENGEIEFTNREIQEYAASLLRESYDRTLALTPTLYAKDVPFFILTLPFKYVQAYVKGILQGRDPVRLLEISFGKQTPAYVVRKLLYVFQSIGLYALAKFDKAARKRMLIVNITSKPSLIPIKVNSVFFKSRPAVLYDIEVTPSHIFTANGVISHNSQNFPKIRGDDFAKEVRYETRKMFEAPIDWGFLELDYKTNEVRGWGIISGDKQLAANFKKADAILARFRKNPTDELRKLLKASDPHTMNAASAFGKEPLQVTKDERQATKSLTFGMIYGMLLATIAKNLKMTLEEAEKVARRFFDSVPQAEQWLYDIERFAALNCYVESPMGRRRRLYNYLLPWRRNPKRYGMFKAEHDRRARNSPIQGMSSDFAFLGAFIFYVEYIVKNNRQWKICNVIHDSTVVLAPVEELTEVALACEWYYTKGVELFLRDWFDFQLPFSLAIDIGMGLNLADMYSWDFTKQNLFELHRKLLKENRLRKRALGFNYKEYNPNPVGWSVEDRPVLLQNLVK